MQLRARLSGPRTAGVAVVAVIVAVTASGGHPHDLAAAGLLVVTEAAALTARLPDRAPVRLAIVAVGAAAGIAGPALAPAGLSAIVYLILAAGAPIAVPERWHRPAGVALSVAYGILVAAISHSLLGLLAGLGAALLYERTIEQRRLQSERDRAVALLAEAVSAHDDAARAAAADERTRIAGELHDVLAHSLAGLSVQLQAARLIATRQGVDASVIEPLDRAAELARSGVQEASAAVAALRTEEAVRDVDIETLVEAFPGRAAYATSGRSWLLPAGPGHAVYRGVQEAMTNAARYAPGSPVEVALRWDADRLEVRVSDGGPAPGHTPQHGLGTGSGLAAMGARLAAAGGAVTSGPSGAGWVVSIDLPRPGEGVAR